MRRRRHHIQSNLSSDEKLLRESRIQTNYFRQIQRFNSEIDHDESEKSRKIDEELLANVNQESSSFTARSISRISIEQLSAKQAHSDLSRRFSLSIRMLQISR